MIGCARGYGPMSFEGGYADREIEPGVHYIDYRGSPAMAANTVVEYWRRRAGELCPAGYDIVSERDEVLAAPATNNVAGSVTARGRAKCK